MADVMKKINKQLASVSNKTKKNTINSIVGHVGDIIYGETDILEPGLSYRD